MTRSRVIFWSGILVAVMPFLGFPGSWKTVMYVIVGLLIASYPAREFVKNRMGVNFQYYRRRNTDKTFVENTEILEKQSQVTE